MLNTISAKMPGTEMGILSLNFDGRKTEIEFEEFSSGKSKNVAIPNGSG